MSDSEKKEDGTRRRYKAPWAPDGPEYDPALPYGPKVYLARKKKEDPRWVVAIEVHKWYPLSTHITLRNVMR